MTAPGTLAITSGSLFDGTGAPPLEPANVVIEDGRISAVGLAESVPVPGRATVIDAAGKTVMPGLIEMHIHVVLSGEVSLYCWLGTGISNSDVLQAATRVAAATTWGRSRPARSPTCSSLTASRWPISTPRVTLSR